MLACGYAGHTTINGEESQDSRDMLTTMRTKNKEIKDKDSRDMLACGYAGHTTINGGERQDSRG